MVISVTNLDKSIKKLGNIGDMDLMPVITKSVRKVQTSAKDMAPVDTGFLRGSIKRKLYPKQNSGIVYTLTHYAPYQEFGTRKMKAQPFLRPAMNMHRAGINQQMKAYIRKELAKQS